MAFGSGFDEGFGEGFSRTDAPVDNEPIFIGPSIGTLVVLVDEAIASIDFSERFTHATDSLTLELTGTLPAGLSFTTDTLSGTPTETGTFSGILVTATDENSDTADTGVFSIQVLTEFPVGYVRRPFNFNWWN